MNITFTLLFALVAVAAEFTDFPRMKKAKRSVVIVHYGFSLVAIGLLILTYTSIQFVSPLDLYLEWIVPIVSHWIAP